MNTQPLLERLRKKRCVLHDADRLHSTLELTNPDGPEAADRIEALIAQVEMLREALVKVDQSAVRNDDDESGYTISEAALAAVAEALSSKSGSVGL
jgi:hypothetical protein